jgi:hypothetical protein
VLVGVCTVRFEALHRSLGALHRLGLLFWVGTIYCNNSRLPESYPVLSYRVVGSRIGLVDVGVLVSSVLFLGLARPRAIS